MRKSDYPKVIRRGVAGLVILLLLFGAFAPAAMAAEWPYCNWNCEAGDVDVTKMWLGDASGNELPSCTPGDTVTAYIWVEFYNNANAARYAVILLADIYINDVLETSIDKCVLDTIPKQSTSPARIYSFSWTCGEEVKLKNIVASWETASGTTCANVERTCTNRGTKCYSSPEIIVRAPLVADFTFDNVCFCTDTTFTDKTTGGNGSYSYDWAFGDGSTHGTAENPIHHYDPADTYTVTLTVTDSDSPPNSDSQSYYDVTVYENPTANAGPDKSISVGDSVVIGGSPTASGGTSPYTYSWSPSAGLDDSTIANPTASPTSTTTYTVTVTDDNGCVDSDDVVVTVTYSISGAKFNDLNDNGINDGEPGLDGWEITLTGPVSGTTTTAGGGLYTFDKLEPGTYTVSETLKTGWAQTAPATGTHTVPLVDTSATDKDFGNRGDLSISGMKFNDLNDNGINDGEPGLDGWEITLTGPVSGTTTTAGGGLYTFDKLEPGTYTVSETLKTGWAQTAPATGTHTVPLVDTSATDKDFGNRGDLSISGMKFNDLNDNGINDGEPGLDGWEITLTGPVSGTTTTAADGSYSFTNLEPGDYTVSEVLKAGWAQTCPATGTYSVTLTGSPVIDRDFGNRGDLSISGMKFNDLNGNGVKDAGEPALGGWTINLAGPVSGTTTTAADGSYSFTNLEPGTYTVSEVLKAGWAQTCPATGTYSVTLTGSPVIDRDFGNRGDLSISGMKFNDLNGNGVKDAGEPALGGWTINLAGPVSGTTTTAAADGSYIFTNLVPGTYTVSEVLKPGWAQTCPATGTYSVTLTGSPVIDRDFGNRGDLSISGMKFNDLNGNGVKDAGEPALGGWTINLAGPVSGTTTTAAADGSYIFTNLVPGTYTVSEVLKPGWAQTCPATGTYSVTLTGSPVIDRDFGNRGDLSISGMKFKDLNGNGVKDAGEPALGGWTINLAGPVSGTTTTAAADGSYIFTNLVPGTYTVSEVLKPGWVQTCPTAPGTYSVTLIDTSVTGKDFGNGAPSIEVVKTASPTEGAPCTDVTFTIEVTNTGDCELNPVIVVDTLPAGMSYVSDDSGGVEGPVGTITWDLGSMGSSAPATTISLVAHIDTGASGTLTDTVTATGTPPHGDDVSDTDTADVTALAPGISVEKVADPTSGAPSTDVTFTITVENTGDCTLNPVMVVDTLPGGMSYVSDDSGGIEGPVGTITWGLGSMGSGATTTIALVAHIDTGASGTLTDTVTAIGTPPHGDDVSDTDTADVTALTPGISVTKTADPTSGAPSTDVTFTITVENTGDCTLNPVTVVDTLPGGMSYVSDDSGGSVSGQEITWGLGSMGSSASTTISLVAHIDTGASGTLTDSVTATGTPPHGDDVSDTDTADVTALTPGIRVTKTADPTSGAPSTDVTFTITVENTGDCTLNPVTVVDTLPGGMSYVSDDSGGSVSGQEITWGLGSMGSSASTTISLVAHIDTGASGTLTDSVTATGTPPHGDDVSDTDTADVTALTPGISVEKVADPTSGAPSTDVTFTITVENTGDCTLNPVMVVDTLPGGMSYVSDDSGGSVSGQEITWDLGSIASGAPATTISLVAHIDTGASGTLTDTVTATGTPPHGDDVSDTDTADVTALAPGISVEKVADPTSGAPSTDVTFTITVENSGDCTLNPVMVVDTLPGGMSYVSDDSGGSVSGQEITWDLGSIASGAPATTISLVAHIDTGASGTLTDTVTATGTPPHGDDVSDTDTADVTALAPGIRVTKTADPTSGAPSTDVTFTITVENTGDCTLNPVMVVDTLPGGMSYVAAGTAPAPSSVVGNTITWTNVGPLNSGASTMITLIAHIDTGASGIMTDVVNVTGTPPAGANVTDSDTADVTALNPGITVNKTANPTAGPVGTDITFTINVTNTGDCTLDPVRVTDELQQGLSYVSSDPIADIHNGIIIWENVGPLTASGMAGDSTTITLVANIDEGASGVLNNTVHVEGKPHCGDKVTDDDIAQVFVLSVVSVELEKTSSPAIVAPGGNVTYTINYTNTGAVPLHHVVITEHYPKGVTFISASPAPDAGTTNVWTIGTLGPGESGTIVIKVKVPEPIDLSFTETGSVIGEGLVMVTKDLSTEQKPYSLRNSVTLSCNELAPRNAYATTKVSGVPGTSLGITESGSGVYSSDEILDLETKNKSIILKKTTHAEYKPTSFNFSDSFSVDFTNKWKQDICSKNMEIDAAIHKKISDATYIDDETISRVDKDKSTMNFDSSFNGSLYVGARTKDTEISETYIGEFDVLQTIQIAKGPIPTPAPTPTPTPIWLPCPFNDSQGNITEDAEPTHDAKIKIEMSANMTSATVGDVIRYSYVVTNIGNINLTGVTVTDSNLGLVDLNRTELEPTEVANGTLLYTVNQSDVYANITNTADVTATDGCGDPVTNTSNQVIVTTDS